MRGARPPPAGGPTMSVTNDETTGRTGTCRHCGQQLEEGLLLKGMVMNRTAPRGTPPVISPGVPVWRRLDRGPGPAKCIASPTLRHDPRTEQTTTDPTSPIR